MTAALDVAALEAIGARPRQEDCSRHVSLSPTEAHPHRLLVVVADGMGGHAAGEVASQTAVEAFLTDARERRAAPAADILAFGLVAAANAVQTAAAADPARADMGTTLLAGVVERAEDGATQVSWISVGDSPLWVVGPGGGARRLNQDQSLAGEWRRDVQEKRISRREAAADPRRHRSNVLTQVLSARASMGDRPDFRRTPLPLRREEILVFATDGAETLTERRIARLARAARPDGAKAVVDDLMQAILDEQAPRQDNVTLVAVMDGDQRPWWRFW
jgi:serine/threonine protein phosphatase PrpC